MSLGKVKETTIEIPMEDGEPLGATPNDKMIVTKVQAGTVSEGKLKIGDQILRVNDTVVKDTRHFLALLRIAPSCARLAIVRDEKKAKELASRDHIPADRERNIIRRDGFSYELVKMTWKAGGPKLGLGIKHFQNRVLVSKTDPASISAECLKIGDQLIDINGKPVTDKVVARRMIVKSFLSTGQISVLIARATSNGAIVEMEHLLRQKMRDFCDDDIPAITQKAIATATYCGKVKHSILSKQRSPHDVRFESDPDCSSSTVTACSNASLINVQNENQSFCRAKNEDTRIPDGPLIYANKYAVVWTATSMATLMQKKRVQVYAIVPSNLTLNIQLTNPTKTP